MLLRYMLLVLLIHYTASQLLYPVKVQPEQIHLSYGGHPGLMWVTWSTMDPTPDPPQVQYGSGGPAKLDMIARGASTRFNAGWHKPRNETIHRVLLRKLVPGRTYMYRVGSKAGWSAIYFFRALKARPGGYRFAVYGDLGNENAVSMGRLQKEAQSGEYDMIFHVGDIAYNMETDNGKIGDEFMRQIEPIAAYVPYMTTPGNHESYNNFTQYVNRFTLPGPNVVFYSFDVGLAHFIGFSTELYFFSEKYANGTARLVEAQYKWMENDLIKAQNNRKDVPWIITMGHRPMYCSTADGDDCNKYESVTRTGGPNFTQYGLENLFYKYGVDLEIWAHEHIYERAWPVYNRTVYNGTKEPYWNPPAPVHILTGSPGMWDHHDPFQKVKPPWSAFRNSDYGYSRMIITNKTHLYWEQFSDDQNKVIDKIWLRKDSHGPYSDAIRQQQGGTYVPYDFVAH